MEAQNEKSYTQDRELSWLKFNKRVLEEAQDYSVPPLERLKFISIFSSNLDEFYMVRVGRLYDLCKIKIEIIDNKSGLTPKQQIALILEKTKNLTAEKEQTFLALTKELKQSGIYDLKYNDLDKNEKKQVDNFYKNNIQPVLSPIIIDNQHPFPHLANKQEYIIVDLKDKTKLKDKDKKTGILGIPTSIGKIFFVEDKDQNDQEIIKYIRTEEIVMEFADQLFGNYQASNKALISVTRNADLNINEEIEEDDSDSYRHHMKKLLKKRSRLSPVRLEVMGHLEENEREFLLKRLKISQEQIFECNTPLNMQYVFELIEKISPTQRKKLCEPSFEPQYPHSLSLDKKIKITDQIKKSDILIHYPYEQMEPFITLLKESANDPNVLAIKITMYRLALRSKIAEQLCIAAENGKEVTVLMELKARFDEHNNIEWAERLEEAGCNVIYGFEEFKVHSKICLITRSDNGEINYITQIGTGNYNEKTARLYSDLSLMTSHSGIGIDANNFFKNMLISNLKGEYQYLQVAPTDLKNKIMELIEAEIQKAKEHKPSEITIKANSLTEKSIIDKLSEASQSGVKIKMIIRGICCMLPGIPESTQNIEIKSIVGRYLEHHRIYTFGKGDEKQIYISSADPMTRNLTRRVEIACPILDKKIKKQIEEMLEMFEKDNAKSRILYPDGNYRAQRFKSEVKINAQEKFMAEAKKERPTEIKENFIKQIVSVFKKNKFIQNSSKYNSQNVEKL